MYISGLLKRHRAGSTSRWKIGSLITCWIACFSNVSRCPEAPYERDSLHSARQMENYAVQNILPVTLPANDDCVSAKREFPIPFSV